MFDINLNNLINQFSQRNNSIKKLDKIPISDKLYLKFIANYKSEEINPDMYLYDYEKSINENSYIRKNHPEVSEDYWMIASSGQGDEWFINIKSQNVFFFDHNHGEYESKGFKDLEISFEDFLKLGFIVQQLENELDEGNDEDDLKKRYFETLQEINSNLYQNYPYKYF